VLGEHRCDVRARKEGERVVVVDQVGHRERGSWGLLESTRLPDLQLAEVAEDHILRLGNPGGGILGGGPVV